MPIAELITLREADWTSLVYSVERGKCTLMLGPDAVTGRLGDEHLPVHVALATFVKGKLGAPYEYLDPTKPSAVAQAAVAEEDPFTLQAWVEDFYRHFESDLDVLRDLAELPFELIVNTSPGYSVHRVFDAVKPLTHSDFYDRTAPPRPMLPDPSVDAPVVYNLFGSLERPSSLILSDNDRLDFIVAVAANEPPLPPKLTSTLRDPDRSCLFLGFDLAKWQFRVLLHVLSPDQQRRAKSFAFELNNAALDTETADFYRSGHRIQFVNADIPGFATELRNRVRPHHQSWPNRPDVHVALPPDAPVAFICHANEDKPIAQQVADALRADGIEAWFDRDKLSGGDEWEHMIRRVISEEVDYVVVLQTERLKAKDVGFVNREIHMALDRQTEYRKPRRFLIPTIVDSQESRIDDLKHLQSTDLSEPDGLKDLVRTIKRDVDLKGRGG